MIINMSERAYDYDRMPGHVITVNFRGLPAPPLDILCRLCLQIHQWKSRNPNNIVVTHCFPGYSRTAVLVSCYQAWSGKSHHPVDALIDVCRGLKIDENDAILPSQKRYLNYFFDILSNGSGKVMAGGVNSTLRVKKLVFTGIPNIAMSEDAKFRPFYEIWSNGKMVYTSLPRDVPFETLLESVVQSYDTPPGSEVVASFDETTDLSDDKPICRGDVLFRIRHLAKSGVRYTCLRFAFNTNYVFDNILHLSQHEIDGNNFPKCSVEIVFESSATAAAQSSNTDEEILYQRSNEISSRLRQGLGLEEVTISLDPPPRIIGATSMGVPEIPIHDNTPVAESGDDVDDFFAQLEREAKM